MAGWHPSGASRGKLVSIYTARKPGARSRPPQSLKPIFKIEDVMNCKRLVLRPPPLNHVVKLNAEKENALFGSPGRLRPERTGQAKEFCEVS